MNTLSFAELDEMSDGDFGFSMCAELPSQHDVEDMTRLPDEASWSWHLPTGSIHFDTSSYIGQLVKSKSVDCVVTDPAYWTLEKHRNVGTTTRLGGNNDPEKRGKWFDTINEDELIELIDECYRVLKRFSHCWMMCDGQTLPYVLGHIIRNCGQSHNFNYYKPFPVIKKAKTGGFRNGMGYHGRCIHEYVVFMAEETKTYRRKFNDENWTDVFEVLWNGDAQTKAFTPDGDKFPTAKPLEFFKRLIELSTVEGETVLDPFMGSGTALVAAQQLGRRFIGMDKSPYAVETTFNRLRAENNLFSEAPA